MRVYPSPRAAEANAPSADFTSHTDAYQDGRDSRDAEIATLREELVHMRETSESWRKAHLAWQQWAEVWLKRLDLQLIGGLWGDREARRILAAELRPASKGRRARV